VVGNAASSNSTSNSLIRQLTAHSQHKFTGRLAVGNPKGLRWDLYFCVGRLVWATSSSYTVRQLRLHLMQHCPTVKFDALTLSEVDPFSGWAFQVLRVLEKRQKISPEQLSLLVNAVAIEVLFDLFQQETIDRLIYKAQERDRLQMVKMQLTVVNLKTVFQQAQQEWQAWNKAGFGKIALNVAPIIKNPQALQAKVSPAAYTVLAKRMTGQRTLRELAVLTKQDPVCLLKSIAPFIKQKWIELAKVADISRPAPPPITAPPTATPPQKKPKPLIACVDDSPQMCQQMESILTKAGYRVLTITDDMKAIPLLLEQKPDLLFLDLVMPVVNGYEVCAQLRRVSAFQKIPIVILTGNDGMIDRMRAKMVKASGFLNKPVTSRRVVAAIQKYLSPTTVT
jgi:two-component system, chemotaxis family, response regulator PixG